MGALCEVDLLSMNLFWWWHGSSNVSSWWRRSPPRCDARSALWTIFSRGVVSEVNMLRGTLHRGGFGLVHRATLDDLNGMSHLLGSLLQASADFVRALFQAMAHNLRTLFEASADLHCTVFEFLTGLGRSILDALK